MARPQARSGIPALVARPVQWSVRQGLLTLALAVGLAWVAVNLGSGAKLLSAAQGLWRRTDLLVLFLSTYTAAFYLRALAWRTLLGEGIGAWRLFSILQIGLLASHVFPTKAGEVVRIGLLARAGLPLGPAISSTIVARLLDFASLCVIALCLGIATGGAIVDLLAFLIAPISAVVGGAVACVLFARGSSARLLAWLPDRLAGPGLEAHVALARTAPRQVAGALALVIPSWLLEAGALWSIARAADVDLSPLIAAAATAFTIAFQAFQFTPGGLGLYEASLTGVLVLYGFDPATGLSLALATHALKFAYSYVFGFPFLLLEGMCLLGLQSAIGAWGQPHPPVASVGESARPGRFRDLWRWPGFLGTSPYPLVGRLRRWADVSLTIALVVFVGAHYDDWYDAGSWLTLLLAVMAAAPLVVLSRCHHLPVPLTPALILVPISLGLAFGVPAPVEGFVAVTLAVMVWPWAARPTLARLLWPALLVQALTAATQRPLAVAGLGFALFAALLIARQWWLTRRPFAATAPLPHGGTVAVLIPVHNEAAAIAAVVDRVPRALLRERGFEALVVVVDDGSTDGSAAIARAAGADTIVSHPVRRGLGAAVRSGLEVARSSRVVAAVYLDGDGEYDPAEIPNVVEPVLRGEADYVLGSRFPAATGKMPRLRFWENRLFTMSFSLLVGRPLRDAQTGFRAFSARALGCAEIVHDYNYAQVLTLDLLRKRMRLAEVPISYRRRRHGRSFIRRGEYLRRVLPAIAHELLGP
ncbi:MAG: flippase-like domain-containing protein [Chloroflexi bacterium]|nr:flippase-like domain-containing protein [Chloroflexota bacterium]